jgi:hypothetical protein
VRHVPTIYTVLHTLIDVINHTYLFGCLAWWVQTYVLTLALSCTSKPVLQGSYSLSFEYYYYGVKVMSPLDPRLVFEAGVQ